MIKQKVDPLVQQAIKKAVEQDGWKEWAETEQVKPKPFKLNKIKTKWGLCAFLKEITP
jgi:predicted metal-dependent hydrolase